MPSKSKTFTLLLALLLTGCASYKQPSPAPLPLQVPAPPPELMTPVEPGSWSELARKQFKDWLRYLTNESNSL